MKNILLITGFLRSGTTLVEKAVHNHPHAAIAAQPFPFLFYHLRNRHREATGRSAKYYALGTLFNENSEELASFTSYLNETVLSAGELAHVFKGMQGYSGALTPGLEHHLSDSCGGEMFHVLCELLRSWSEKTYHSQQQLLGLKEVYVEEFLPYWLTCGGRALLVIRDPRDMVASILDQGGAQYVNTRLPLLYILRQWRKSVAFALALSGHAGFMSLRFEDFVNAPDTELQKIANLTDLPPFPEGFTSSQLRDQDGHPWSGNASNGTVRPGISPAPIATYLKALSPQTCHYIEVVCGPEMRAMGYELQTKSGDPEECERTIANMSERPNALSELPRADDPSCQEEELQRLALLQQDYLPDTNQHKFFILPGAFERLKETI